MMKKKKSHWFINRITLSPLQAEFTFFDFEWSVILTDKATVNCDHKRDITVYFINGKLNQLSHMKSGKLDFCREFYVIFIPRHFKKCGVLCYTLRSKICV